MVLENHSDSTSGRTGDEPDEPAREPKAPSGGDEARTERFKGLCVNCDHRFDCLLPRPEGGVWHCEEYR